MFRKSLIVIAFVAAVSEGRPVAALADHHGGGGHQAVFVGGYYYHPYFYDPWFGPWGPWYPPYAYGYYPAFIGPEADLRILAKPTNAEVYVDGYFAGIVDEFDGFFQRLHVTPGQHEITLHLEGYRTANQKLYLPANTTYKLRYNMEKLATGEMAEPPPTPPAAPAGVPAQPQPAPPQGAPGRMPPGYPPAPPPAVQGPARGPASESTGATLAIRVQPSGADVLIDGEQWQGPEGDERLLVQVSEGSHHIQIHKDGYRRFSTDIHARRGETVPLNVALTSERD